MADLLYASVLEKSTQEQFDEGFEFNGIIPESTTVFSRSVSATRIDGVDVTDEVVVGSSFSGTIVTVTLATGAEDTAYLIRVAVESSTGTPSVLTKLLNVTEPGVYR